MNIAFDAHPLISEKMSGIGYCEAGQISHIMDMHPENNYQLQFFSLRNHDIKLKRLENYNCEKNYAVFSNFLYRAMTNFIPLPYSSFFGKSAELTHFFNYIVPTGVKGKAVVTVHDMVIKAYPETVRFRTRKMLETGLEKSMKRADIIVTDSVFSQKEIGKYYPQFTEKIRVVPCGVDNKKFFPEKNTEKIKAVKKKYKISKDYFLYLGTVEPRKNLERLIEAYSIFCKSCNTPPRLVMAGGNGWLNTSIYEKSETLGIKENIIFTDYIASEDLCPLMCGATAFLFPSIYEGFGMPPLEAMACGVPVLVSSEASLPEVVGDCAVITNAFSVQSIADGIGKLYSDEKLRNELSEKGFNRSRQFSWKNSAEILYNIYCEAINL